MKSGFIGVVGRPNVGKSTLMNKLVEEKVAIISDKAGTTRDRIKGIVNKGENQYIFVDTPGIHKPKHLLGEHMTETALNTLNDVDVIMFILDGTQEISTGDLFIVDYLKKTDKPVVIVVNKIDKMTDEEIKDKEQEIINNKIKYEDIIFLSAEYGIGTYNLYDLLEKYLISDVWYYPEDMYTDMPVNKIVVEVVREKLLHNTKHEIPHSIAVEIIDVQTKDDRRVYDINIYVERESQKGIVIGNKGSLLKKVGILARKEIEHLTDMKIRLNLWVKVKKKWRKKKDFLKELGYNEK